MFDRKAYNREYNRRFLRTRNVFVSYGLCLRCGEPGGVHRQVIVNLRTGRVSPDGWSVHHGPRGRPTSHYVGVMAYPLDALRNPLRAILTESV